MSGSKWRNDPLFRNNRGVQEALQNPDYIHFRTGEHTFTDHEGIDRVSRGHVRATFAVVRCPGNLIVVGLAFCHPDDVSSKKIGRVVAKGRAEGYIAELLGVHEAEAAPVRTFESEESFEHWLQVCRAERLSQLRRTSVTYVVQTINE